MAAGVAGAVGAAGAAQSAERGFPKRDFTGLWSNASYTDFERPAELKTLVVTPAEAEAFEASRRATFGMPASKPGEVGQAESEFNERGQGLARVHGEIRSSWIIDPPNGHIPYTPQALAMLGFDKTPRPESFDNPEDRPHGERCLASLASGAPMMIGADTNHFLFVQTKDVLAIYCEKYHDVRMIRLDGAPRPTPLVRSWMGDSVGGWDGDTLVVETVGFRPGLTSRGFRFYLSGDGRVVERFTRTAADAFFYEFSVEDPTLFSQVWKGEITWETAQGQIYEYACHEGNYAVRSILSAARQAEAKGR